MGEDWGPGERAVVVDAQTTDRELERERERVGKMVVNWCQWRK